MTNNNNKKNKFLAQLLRKENIVPIQHIDGEQQECLICKEEYGAETQIRLPCNPKHTVGSNCIAVWLKDHNTCPVCRCEFFPAEGGEAGRGESRRLFPLERWGNLFLDEDDDEEGGVDGDEDDEDFVDEGGDADEEDENMSSDEDGDGDELEDLWQASTS